MVHFTLYTLYSRLHTPHSTRDTPALYTLNCTLYAPQLTPYTLYFTLYTVHCTLPTLHFQSTLYTSNFSLSHFAPYTLDPRNCAHFTLYAAWNLGLASCPFCASTPTSRHQLPFLTALLLPALSKVHSDAESGPLNFPRSLVIVLAMLNFFILFQQCALICSHPRPP